jgi:hypoxanthine phosphoribosyltransferase
MVDATSIIDYDYNEFKKGIELIADQIEDSNFVPDYIVGIVRGGAVPAVYLSHKLKLPLVTIAWSTRDNSVWENESSSWIPQDIAAGSKVLIVDDIVDGGDTIRELLTDWYRTLGEDLPLDNIRVAAMYYNTAQDVKVDYFHHTIDRTYDQRWIHFPWEG